VAVIAVNELIVLARSVHLHVSMTVAAFATSMVVYSSRVPEALDLFLVTALIGGAALTLGAWQGGGDALATVSASLFPALYIGLPIAAMVGIRARGGPPALFLLMLTIIVSDSMQYYTGRLFGRRPLAPLVSPKKTVEGALGGAVFGTSLFTIVGAWWLPAVPATGTKRRSISPGPGTRGSSASRISRTPSSRRTRPSSIASTPSGSRAITSIFTFSSIRRCPLKRGFSL